MLAAVIQNKNVESGLVWLWRGVESISTNNLPVKKYKNRRACILANFPGVLFFWRGLEQCVWGTMRREALSTKNTSDIWFLCLRIKFNENKNMSS